ncbi:DUF3046 domain-containing protein [Georgenia yuyongxinii]|uniref:DUF3046 domain-containing protein n=1 Tax=Georgenia yuyongxinii TaxID=2589797 RepID=A0A552WQI9_9MICO|nr:DUF3046 domain-containing protein [Georgenia yuyongxinii]TRW45032.1 DUF3046 domain-containing protein [Georgenia yuyongxinii]
MKHSEFWQVVEEAFGAGYGRSLAADLVLTGVGGRTAAQALDAGVAPREVWAALCDEMEVDDATRWRHRRDPKERDNRR